MEAEFSSPQPAFIRLGRNEVHLFRGPGHGFENIDDFGLPLVAELLILEDKDLPIPKEITQPTLIRLIEQLGIHRIDHRPKRTGRAPYHPFDYTSLGGTPFPYRWLSRCRPPGSVYAR